mmetsp:Transcript_40691/g.80183  ORF Transcript_40691/g.80183 Transcript_40691/m.80183 type:complete len:211 (+) Transcript_40691:389-1021(+)
MDGPDHLKIFAVRGSGSGLVWWGGERNAGGRSVQEGQKCACMECETSCEGQKTQTDFDGGECPLTVRQSRKFFLKGPVKVKSRGARKGREQWLFSLLLVSLFPFFLVESVLVSLLVFPPILFLLVGAEFARRAEELGWILFGGLGRKEEGEKRQRVPPGVGEHLIVIWFLSLSLLFSFLSFPLSPCLPRLLAAFQPNVRIDSFLSRMQTP